MKTEDNLYSVVIVVVGIVVVVVVVVAVVVVVVGRVRTLTSIPFPPASCLLSRLLLPILCQSSQIKVRKTEHTNNVVRPSNSLPLSTKCSDW